jgi:MFS family permease
MLTVLLAAWFMAQFDFFVVNVAAPSLERGLGAGPAALELIVGGYAFAYAAGMVTGGRLGDLLGHRRMFVAGVVAFTAASLLCGIAATPGQLVAARVLQGFAGAAMVPQVLAMITTTLPADARPRALGWYGVAGGLGSIAGQVLGGILLDSDVLGLGWRVIFLVNVPVGLAVVPLALRLPPSGGRRTGARTDPLGALGLAAALGLVLVPLALGRGAGWPVWTWCCLAAALPAGALTLYWQRRLAARGGLPVLDMSLFRERTYVAGIAACVAFMAYFAGFMFVLTLLLQGGRGLSALGAGLAFAPMGVLFAATSLLGSRLVARFGQRVVLAGCAVTLAGLALLALIPAGAGLGWMIVALMFVGAGNGLTLPQLIGVAMVRVPAGRAGAGAGVLTTAQQFAGAAGVAVLGTVFFALAAGHPGGSGYAAALPGVVLIHAVLLVAVTVLVAYVRRVSAR